MKQQIKCPHCNKAFPIEESLKHEAQELRKKLQAEEQISQQRGQSRLPADSGTEWLHPDGYGIQG